MSPTARSLLQFAFRPARWSDQVSAIAIIELDSRGVVGGWNAGAERIHGYAREEIIDSHFSIFYRPEDRERGIPEALLAAALQNGYVEEAAWRVRSDGGLFWAHVTISSLRDGHGRLTGYVKLVQDLTSSKQADDERDAFLRSFAHDFLSPITAVRGYVDLLREDGADSDRLLDALETVSDHLIEMTASLSKRAREVPAPPPQPVQIEVIVREAASLVLPGDVYGRLSISIDDRDVLVRAHSTELRRALQNVLENAAKYSEHQIRVRVYIENDSVVISIRDQGRGIHEDDLATILQDGQRGRLARPDDGGSGIGLANTTRAIEADGGTIRIESEVGSGTTVQIRLPLVGRENLPD